MSKQSFDEAIGRLPIAFMHGVPVYLPKEAVVAIMNLIREHLADVKESLAYEDETEGYYYALDMLAERLGL